jgi:hypothetical protein
LEQSVSAYKLSEIVQERIEALLEKNRAGVLTQAELTELDDYMRLEHVIRVAKAKLRAKVAF